MLPEAMYADTVTDSIPEQAASVIMNLQRV